MVISHQHRYLFIEHPFTASWAIRHELCDSYGGEPILRKHASYRDFLRIAEQTWPGYFVFGTVRHPLDEVVSRYFRLKSNHKGVQTGQDALSTLLIEQADREKFNFVQTNNASFEMYFRRYHQHPFSSTIDLNAGRFDFVLRYESLEVDFETALDHLHLRSLRPIPIMNPTAQRERDWRQYYTDAIIPQAKRMFWPFMRRWDYAFPAEWGPSTTDWRMELAYRLWRQGSALYTRRFRHARHPLGRMGRAVRGVMAR